MEQKLYPSAPYLNSGVECFNNFIQIIMMMMMKYYELNGRKEL